MEPGPHLIRAMGYFGLAEQHKEIFTALILLKLKSLIIQHLLESMVFMKNQTEISGLEEMIV